MQTDSNDQAAGMFQKIKSSFREIFGGGDDSPRLAAEAGGEKDAVPAGE